MREYHIIDVNGNAVNAFPETINSRELADTIGSSIRDGITVVGEDNFHYPIIAILVDTIMVGNPLY